MGGLTLLKDLQLLSYFSKVSLLKGENQVAGFLLDTIWTSKDLWLYRGTESSWTSLVTAFSVF